MIFLRDIERCPYVPKDPEYAEWTRKDNERLEKLFEVRQHLLGVALQYLSHMDRNVRNMAIFVVWILRREE